MSQQAETRSKRWTFSAIGVGGRALPTHLSYALLALSLTGTSTFAQQPSTRGNPSATACGNDLVISRSTTLEAHCRYTGSATITGSNLVLDCQGATLDAEFKEFYPLLIGGRSRVSNVEVRNCNIIRGLGSGVFIGLTTPDSEKPTGSDGRADYAQHPQNITLRNVSSRLNRNGGFYVDDYVQQVTIQDSVAEENGQVGIYLEHDSRQTRIANTRIARNGFGVVPGAPNTRPASREGISIDSSSDNIIENNTIVGNKAGGVFLYRNCGEQPNDPRQVPRTMPSANNIIRNNTVEDGNVGIWIASRQETEIKPSSCRLRVDAARGIFPDAAPGNAVTGNTLRNVGVGIRVADDNNTVDNNQITALRECMMLGSAQRNRMGRPVSELRVQSNACQGRPVSVLPNTSTVRDNGSMTR